MRTRMPVGERLAAKLTSSPTGCIEWQGATNERGYGLISLPGRSPQRVHRVAWEQAHGKPIPKGLLVCHSCDNRLCCNPEHLFLGTAKDNMHDMIDKGRSSWQSRDQCVQGHDYTPENTYRDPRGARRCRKCRARWAA